MSTVFALYTGHGLMEPLSAVFTQELPDDRLINVVDDSIIHDTRRAGSVTPEIALRILSYYSIAVQAGADIIFNTCSSVGDVADNARQFISIPIVRIDRSMAQRAVEQGNSIGVVATLPTTLEPTVRLVESEARLAGKAITVKPVLASGAYDALVAGDRTAHDRLIEEAALQATDHVDTFVLAQGSMARMETALSAATGKTVLSSIRLGIMDVAAKLKEITVATS